MKKVQLFEQIRKNYLIDNKSIRSIARMYGIHRRQVRQAIKCAIPPERKRNVRSCNILLPRFKGIIDQWLKADLSAPRKQRHTSKRIYERLATEHCYLGSEGTIRNYIGEKLRELNIPTKVYVPQVYVPGEEAEVDWYEAFVEFPYGQEKIFIFQMRACYSGKEFHIAFNRQNQQSFLEAHIAAFKYFDGVFKKIRYDNLTAAIKKVLKGRKRIETERFITMRSHYLFDSEFCLPGIQGAHEKGGVECGVGRFRRAHLVPVPKVFNLAELNKLLLSACQKDDQRTIIGKTKSITEDWQEEKIALNPLPLEEFSAADVVTASVNNKSLIAVRGSYYSVPVNYVGQKVDAYINAENITVIKQCKIIAEHKHYYERHKIAVELSHYLPLFKIKPGALTKSLALQQAKQNGKWPEVFDKYWKVLILKYGQQYANRQLVDFLLWARDFELVEIVNVITKAMEIGCYEIGSIKTIMRQQNSSTDFEPLDKNMLGLLSCYDRPKSDVNSYNQLLSGGKNESYNIM